MMSFPACFPDFNGPKSIKVGDSQLESGEEGRVEEITWRNTQIRTLEGSTIIIPNAKLIQTTNNYGKQPKLAKQPFQFSTRLHLRELHVHAGNLSQLASNLKEVPEAVVYYHTHNLLRNTNFLLLSTNDFALWVRDALG